MSFVVSAPPSSSLVFDLPLSLQGLTASVDEHGQLILTDGGGKVVAQANPAVMFGAAVDEGTGEPLANAPVHISIIGNPGAQVLEIAPDMSFFTRPDVTYPVRVDPSPSLSVNVDTYVKDSNPSSSYSTDSQLKSGYDSVASAVARSYLSFSGMSVLDNTHIFTAALRLYEVKAYSCTTSEVDVRSLTSAFTSSTTWNTKPTEGSLYASEMAAHGDTGCANDWVELSGGGASGLTLVDLVQGWANGNTNYGLEVRAASETDANGWKKFNSADAGNHVPTLEVTYNAQLTDTSDNADGTSWWKDGSSYGTWPQSTTSFDPYGLQNPSRKSDEVRIPGRTSVGAET